ncbi:MAG TPA: JAB domain-containing protein [Sphingobium sp.]
MTKAGNERLGTQWGLPPEWPAMPSGDPHIAPEPGQEMLVIWLLNHNGTLAATIRESRADNGQRRRVTLPLPAIARALATTGATSLFMAHSHPSGDPRPSHADIDATRQIWRLARTLGASLQDHLVIADPHARNGSRRMFSFRASGLL